MQIIRAPEIIEGGHVSVASLRLILVKNPSVAIRNQHVECYSRDSPERNMVVKPTVLEESRMLSFICQSYL
jgi:hypothetical protein